MKFASDLCPEIGKNDQRIPAALIFNQILQNTYVTFLIYKTKVQADYFFCCSKQITKQKTHNISSSCWKKLVCATSIFTILTLFFFG